MSSNADELSVAVELVSTELVKRPTAPLHDAAASLIEVFPSYKDTKSGRRGAKQLKIVLGVVGLITILAGRDVWPVIACGFIVMSFAIFLPIEALKKRSLVNNLKRSRADAVKSRRPGKLVHDGRRLLLYDGDTRDRRVLTNRAFLLERFAGEHGETWIQVAPNGSKKKKEAIWICVEDLPPAKDLPPVKSFRVDAPAYLSHARAKPLLERLDEVAKG